MNIYYLTGNNISYPPKAVAVHVAEIANALALQGHKVCLYAPASGPPITSHPGFSLKTVPSTSKFDRSKLARRFVQDLITDRPDWIYFRTNVTLTPVMGIAKLLGIPFVVEVNGITRLEGESPSWCMPCIDAVTGWAFRNALVTLPVTEELKEDLHRRFRVPYRRIVVVPNGTNADMYRPLPRDQALIDCGDRPTVGFMGGFGPWQGVELAIDAMVDVRRRFHDVMLLLAGDGPARPQLESRVKRLGLANHVTFVGLIPYEESSRFLAGCDVMVCPFRDYRRNRHTGLSPLKIFMYMACGKAFVVAKLPYLEWLERHGICRFCAPNDSRSLAEEISTLLDRSSQQRDQIGDKGRRCVLEHYTWKVLAERITRIVQERLASTPPLRQIRGE